MAINSLTRRAFVKSLGAFGMAMPFAQMLHASVAEGAAAFPLRLVLICSPHGSTPDYWNPKAGETDFDISFANAALAPLAPYRSKLFIPVGVDMASVYESSANPGYYGEHAGHQGGPCSLFTGTAPVTKSGDLWPTGPSIDQFLAATYGAGTKFPSLQLGVGAQAGYSSFDSFFFGAGGARLPSIDSPLEVYNKVFKNLMVPGGPPTQQADAKKRLVLDTVKADIGRLSKRLVGPEKQKLEAHLTAIDTIEKRISATVTVACQKPAAPAAVSAATLSQYPTISTLQMDLISQIIACDLSRFISLQYEWGGAALGMPWIGLNLNTHDDLAHLVNDPGATGATARLNLAKTNAWYASQLAYLMGRLEAIPEGNGTALDNTIILWGNELGNPASHDNIDQPFVIAGGCGGKFRTGRCVKFSQGEEQLASQYSKLTPHNGILVAICQAFGMQVNAFGHPGLQGALPGLLA